VAAGILIKMAIGPGQGPDVPMSAVPGRILDVAMPGTEGAGGGNP